MNLDDLSSRVEQMIRNDGGFISPEEITDWLNDGYRDLAARLELFEKSTDGTTASDGTIALPSDCYQVLTLNFGTVEAESVHRDVFDTWRDAAAAPDQPLFRIASQTIQTYPAQESTDYTLVYFGSPTPLANGTDVPAIPEHLQMRLVHYARAQAMFKDRDPSAADHWGLYIENLPEQRIQPVEPGPQQMMVAPGVFDEDDDWSS